MKINGSLSLDASSLSEIQNLRIEKLAALPLFTVGADVGRLIFNTGDNVIYAGNATQWVPVATGGDATALVNEINAIEASIGALVNAATGAYNAAGLTGTLAASTSITDVFTKIQTIIAKPTYFLYTGADALNHSVVHNLNEQFCNVTVVNNANEAIIPQSILFTDPYSLTVTFAASMPCKVVVTSGVRA